MEKVGLAAIIVVVMMILPAGLFAGGSGEEGIDTGFYDTAETTASGYPKVNITYEQKAGVNVIYLKPKNWNADYGIVKVTENGQTVYRSVNENGSILSETEWAAFTNAAHLASLTLTENSALLFSNLITIEGSKGTTSDIGSIKNLGSSYGSNPIRTSAGKKASLIYDDYSMNKEFDVVLFNESKSEYLRFKFTMKTEFFHGEYNYFQNVTGTYKEKAVSFLGEVLGDDFINHFDELNTGLTGIDWNLFDPGADEDAKTVLNKSKNDFKRKLSMHIESIADGAWSEKYPVLDTKKMFESIYGENSNIYISTYLRYLSFKNKPLLSELYFDLFDREGRDNNYTEFKPITDVEGETLARNALRYYTWGLEYTPFSGYNNIVNTTDMREVFQYYFSNADLQSWLASHNLYSADTNYFNPAGMGGANIKKPSESLVETNTVEKITVRNKDTENSVVLGRVDIWSARNVIWGLHSNARPIVSSVTGTTDNYQISAPFSESELATKNITINALKDKVLIKESNGGTTFNNVHIEREGTEGIGIGYDFGDTDALIKAVLVIKGSSTGVNKKILNNEKVIVTDPAVEYPEMDESGEFISLFFADEDGNWIKLQPSEYQNSVL